MTDAADLRALSTGYAAAVDRLDGAAFADLFTADGELWVPEATGDRAPTVRRAGTDVLARIPSGLRSFHVTHHRVGPARYTVDGDTASGEVAGVAHHLAAAPSDGGTAVGTDTIWYIRYVDDYRRDGGRWRIARRVLHLVGVEERPLDHLGPGR
jgi:ketosteroid isomerase-like protein